MDYFYTVPPKSSANKRATQHALLNITLLLIFTFALILRQNPDVNFLFVLMLEGTGIILLTISGWLGGTLVVRNQIGIDHRYAEAGKWKEETIDDTSGIIELHYLNKLKVNQMKLMHINGKRIVIGRTETGFSAFEDRCTHRGGSLADGVMIADTVQCPWHGSQFKVKSGKTCAGPATENIKVYKIEQKDEKFYLHQ
jgi:nitrite reductase/ring-hydroxylating ferredoxin subunit